MLWCFNLDGGGYILEGGGCGGYILGGGGWRCKYFG